MGNHKCWIFHACPDSIILKQSGNITAVPMTTGFNFKASPPPMTTFPPPPEYYPVFSGSCPPGELVDSIDVCSAIANSILPFGGASVFDNQPYGVTYDPPGCYYENDQFKFNAGNNTGNCSYTDVCVCVPPPTTAQPITTNPPTTAQPITTNPPTTGFNFKAPPPPPPAAKKQWVEVGVKLECDGYDGEVYLESSRGKVPTLAACKASCESAQGCQSISYFKSGWCAHWD